MIFFFQAEDGIRDGTVTGVQTCALPIYVKLEACFAADGVMLRTLTSAGALFSFEQRATSVSATVTDADFVLPYPVTSAPFPIPTSAPLKQTPRPTPTH